jgi:glycosyltransferase involved in cell wall biosynthesis
VVFFQGEDAFLDSLPEPYAAECWSVLAQRLMASDLMIAPSRFYATFMSERMSFSPDAVAVIHNGIQLETYGPAHAPPPVPTIGYLARMSREKGLELLVDAFLILKRELGDSLARLKIAGAATAGDQHFIAAMKRRIAEAELESSVEWSPNVTRDEKVTFLRSLTLFSVPAVYSEAFGLYLLEAMACGIPVVQPEAAAFSEIIQITAGGICVRAGDARALAQAWYELLPDQGRRAALGSAGRAGVEQHFNVRKMSGRFLELTTGLMEARV